MTSSQDDTMQSPQGANRLAQRLAQVRRARFVGRTAEIAAFRQALDDAEPPHVVFFLYGPGGIGKTTLLQEYGALAQGAARRVVYLDGRDVDPSPVGFLLALGMALEVPARSVTPEMLAHHPDLILLIDTYEALSGLDHWLRGVLLPNLAGRSLVAIAGRDAPGAAWRTDLAWAELTRVMALRNLAPDECRTYLSARAVSPTAHAALLSFTHGHPLALALVADLAAQGARAPDLDAATPDLLRVLLDAFVQAAPSPHHHLGLQVCAHVRMTTEALLTDLLGENGRAIFTWLRGLSFIQHGPFGLFPHDLARDVLDGDLRWRDPAGYVALHHRVRASLSRQFRETSGIVQQQMFLNILYLHRHNPLIGPYYDWNVVQSVYTEAAPATEHAQIVDIVARHEGAQQADIAAYWLQRQPEAFHVVRTEPATLIGLVGILTLETPTTKDLATDPVLAAAWQHIQATAPLRPGEVWLLHRFWLDAEQGQVAGNVYNMVSVVSARAWLTLPNLSWSILAPIDLATWEPALRYIRHTYVTEVPVPRPRHLFAHDWRGEPWEAWMEAMADRELETQAQPDALPAPQTEPLQVLAEEDFAEAVRLALRDFTRPDELARNPLLYSRLLNQERTPAALQALLHETVTGLNHHPRDAKLYRALYHTYLAPEEISQERVAELLDLPFSTYRYHLTNGVKRVIGWFWQRELQSQEITVPNVVAN